MTTKTNNTGKKKIKKTTPNKIVKKSDKKYLDTKMRKEVITMGKCCGGKKGCKGKGGGKKC